MKIKNIIPALFKTFGLFLLMGFLVSCTDKINVNPANYSNNVDIEFSSDDDSIDLGGGTTLHWGVSDPDGAVETVNLTGGGVDQIIDLSGSKTVSPTESTVYYIDTFSESGKLLKSIQTKVTVLDATGAEITEGGEVAAPEVETVCDDTVDNDEDGMQDCDDSDCTADPTCAAAAIPVAASFTTEPSFSHEGELLCIGDSVTITWTSDFSGVQVSTSTGSEKYFLGEEATNGSYTIDALSVEETVVTLVGDKDYAYSEPKTLTIKTNTTEECNPGFIGRFSSSIYPSSSLIKGEAYALQWSSTDVSDVTLDGTHVDLDQSWQDSEVYYANNKTYSFKLWDTQDPVYTDESHSTTVTANSFTTTAQATLSAGVNKVIPGADAATAYIISGAKVVKATEYLTVFGATPEIDAKALTITVPAGIDHPTTGIKEDVLTSYAVTQSGKKVISTDHYVYLVDGTKAEIIKNTDFSGYEDLKFNFVHTVEDVILVGSTEFLYKYDAAASCSEREKIAGICCSKIDLDGNSQGSCGGSDRGNVDYRTIFKKYSSADNPGVYIVTSEGVYKSSDQGLTFKSNISSRTDIVGGSWLGSRGGFIWSDSSVYDYQGSEGFVALEGLPSTGGEIYYVNLYGGRIFVATANGVYVKNDIGWSESAVFSSTGGTVPFLTFKNSQPTNNFEITDGGVNITKIKPTKMVSEIAFTAVLLTNKGATATVEYRKNPFWGLFFNATFTTP